MDKAALAQVNKLKKGGGVGYVETHRVVVVDKAEYNFSFNEEFGAYAAFLGDEQSAVLNRNMSLRVHYDGVDYTCNGVEFYGNVIYGNTALVEPGNDTGEPFVFAFNGQNILFGSIHTDTTHTIGISGTYQATRPIDVIYMPEVVVPKVIDLDAYSIGESIVNLISLNGGSSAGGNEKIFRFWEDVSTDRPLKLIFNGADNTHIEISSPMIQFDNTGKAVRIYFNMCFANFRDSKMQIIHIVLVKNPNFADSMYTICELSAVDS